MEHEKANLEYNFSEEVLTRRPNTKHENRGMDSREKRTIQPATPLRYELRDLNGMSVTSQEGRR